MFKTVQEQLQFIVNLLVIFQTLSELAASLVLSCVLLYRRTLLLYSSLTVHFVDWLFTSFHWTDFIRSAFNNMFKSEKSTLT